TANNRGPEAATLHLLPQLWYRNTWSWNGKLDDRPQLSAIASNVIQATHASLGTYHLYCDGSPHLLFCENETNVRRLFGMHEAQGYFKDGIHDCVVNNRADAVNPQQLGTKAAAHYTRTIPAGGSISIRLRLSRDALAAPFADFDEIVTTRQREADDFYEPLQHDIPDEDVRRVQRQAWAGMIWSQQFYHYDVRRWLEGDAAQPPPPDERRYGRNWQWRHLNNADVISMPDNWEFPWYASWDLAFHCITLAMVDAEFAKNQLVLLCREWYMHPNAQLPAYEWNFGDVNPPVHAWSAWRVFQIDRKQRGDAGDHAFLERVFHKLMLNFTWWVNRKDPQNRNVFDGGFLGLDNIGVFDRSAPLPDGTFLRQADATSWMAMYALNLMRMALELATVNNVYEDVATKFFEHFLQIAEAMTNVGGDGDGVSLWDEEDQFFYDALHLSDGRTIKLKVRSTVGLIPLFAVETLEPELLDRVPQFNRRLRWYLKHRPDLAALVSRWDEPGRGERRLLSLLRGHRMKMLLRRMLDESEFLSDYGVRSLSKFHARNPYVFDCSGQAFSVDYEPAESRSGIFGGNSNWRGPVWMPINYLIIESLQKFHHYYGDDFKIECPTGSGRYLTICGVAEELTRRVSKLFLRGADGRRASQGSNDKLHVDENFRNSLQFFEYFHGDTGRGLGASHQTGWTGLIAKLLCPRRVETCEAQEPVRAATV
ncbi:MAG TPA: glucosidase, partial [Pirellulales bacterium]|nr:glucosidase [Pirellulales bacterium]